MIPIYGYATHLPALADAVLRTDGPVLELGSGKYSTPFLHMICGWSDPPRELVTIEDDELWLADVTLQWCTPEHRVERHFEDLTPIMREQHWSVVFIDCKCEDRVKYLELFADHATFLVCHDTSCLNYGYEPAILGFKFARVWSNLQPWTTVVSNERRP